MMYLITWKANMSLFPTDQEERTKLTMSWTEKMKKDLDSGKVKMWGISIGGGKGFSVVEGSGKEIFADSMFYTPYLKSKVKPMLSFDEWMDAMKGMQP